MKKVSLKAVVTGIGGALALFAVMQAVPYGRAHTNPPVVKEPAWDSPGTRALAKRACFDCHSHETVWLWYSKIAPASWLVQYDVDEGRKELNFSAWNGAKEGEQPAKMIKQIQKGEMPPFQYTIIHPEARLSAAEKDALIQGLSKTAGR